MRAWWLVVAAGCAQPPAPATPALEVPTSEPPPAPAPAPPPSPAAKPSSVELCTYLAHHGFIGVSVAMGPLCARPSAQCVVRSPAGTANISAVDIDLEVGEIPEGTCDKPAKAVLTSCVLPTGPSKPDPHGGYPAAKNRLPRRAKLPVRVAGREVGTLSTDDDASPSPHEQCWTVQR